MCRFSSVVDVVDTAGTRDMFVDRISISGGKNHGTHHADPRVASIGDLSKVTFALFFAFLFPVSRGVEEGGGCKQDDQPLELTPPSISRVVHARMAAGETTR
jgi:hypothetical protein